MPLPPPPEVGETHLLRWAQHKVAEVRVCSVQEPEVVIEVNVNGHWRGAIHLTLDKFWERHIRAGGSS